MPLTGLSKYVKAEKRCLIEAAWEDAWQDLKRGGLMNAAFARRTLASAIVTLASTGESDAVKLKRLALQITRMDCALKKPANMADICPRAGGPEANRTLL